MYRQFAEALRLSVCELIRDFFIMLSGKSALMLCKYHLRSSLSSLGKWNYLSSTTTNAKVVTVYSCN